MYEAFTVYSQRLKIFQIICGRSQIQEETHMKKAISLALALSLASVLSTTAFAAAIEENGGKQDIGVKAKYIVEGANGPTSYEADQILNAKGKIVVPDILANAGGVIVSYFEWVQNIQNLTWDLDEVNKMLQKIMLTAFNEVYALSQEKNVTLRMAAYMVAIKRITTAGKLRGGPISMG